MEVDDARPMQTFLVLGGRFSKTEGRYVARGEIGQGRNYWQWAKHARLYSDQLETLKGELL